jgi:hypothetical protein
VSILSAAWLEIEGSATKVDVGRSTRRGGSCLWLISAAVGIAAVSDQTKYLPFGKVR